jgi:hypothetical protein
MGYERFAQVERAIEIGGDRYTFWQPPDLDALIDVEAFERDERIPYRANVWESALVLAEEIADMDPGGRKPPIVLKQTEHNVVVTVRQPRQNAAVRLLRPGAPARCD